MSQEMSFEVKADRLSEYYGTLTVFNISGKVSEYLGISFKAPVNVTSDKFNGSTDPWMELKADLSSQQVDASTFLISGKISFPNEYTFNGKEVLTFYVDGDLNNDPEQYTESFILSADKIPSGIVNIQTATAPDPGLVDSQQEIIFTAGSFSTSTTVNLDTTTSFEIAPGTYNVSAAVLTNDDETIVAAAQVSPATVTVENNKAMDISVSYGQVDKYSAINVAIGDISPLQDEKFHVTVEHSGQTLADFWTPANHTTPLHRLPPNGTISISVDSITLNNVQYSFDTKNIDVSASLYEVTFQQADSVVDIDTSGFVQVPIVVVTDITLDRNVTVRLLGASPENFLYTQKVPAKDGITLIAVPVAPGQYTVQVPSFIQDFTVYVVKAPTMLNVDDSPELALEILRGANLNVPGFPEFLSFGGITDLTAGNEDDFVKAKASSIFRYAGTDGAGDAGGYLNDDPRTVRAVQLAHAVAQRLGKPVLPVMISYTVNLSGGNWSNLEDPQRLAHSFANLIVSIKDANETAKTYSVPAVGWIVNADLLGACQQHGLSPSHVMPVRQPLQDALNHWNIQADIPDSITENLLGYVLAVNWLVRTAAEKLEVTFKVTFGWQVNLWGVGSSIWIYGEDDPAAPAGETAAYLKSLAVYDGPYAPDFLAVDRYEADDFTPRAYVNSYCYGPYEWPRFFDFTKWLSVELQVPIVAWQIPSSHTPLVSDDVLDDFAQQHWGTGGSFILGDQALGPNYNNINPKLLAFQLPVQFSNYTTVKDIFIRGEPFDWSTPAYPDFPLLGIVSVMLGGGETTGIISSIGNAGKWVLDRLSVYGDHPIPLDNTDN